MVPETPKNGPNREIQRKNTNNNHPKGVGVVVKNRQHFLGGGVWGCRPLLQTKADVTAAQSPNLTRKIPGMPSLHYPFYSVENSF